MTLEGNETLLEVDLTQPPNEEDLCVCAGRVSMVEKVRWREESRSYIFLTHDRKYWVSAANIRRVNVVGGKRSVEINGIVHYRMPGFGFNWDEYMKVSIIEMRQAQPMIDAAFAEGLAAFVVMSDYYNNVSNTDRPKVRNPYDCGDSRDWLRPLAADRWREGYSTAESRFLRSIMRLTT